MTPSSGSQPRPVLPSEVRDTLEQALQSGSLEVPMLPSTVIELMEACSDESIGAALVSTMIERDQALASNVLRMANSAAYAPKNPIGSLQDAVSRLGITTIRDITTSLAVKGRVFSVPGYQTKARRMWMHAAAAAVYAKEIAKQIGRDEDSAFLCGLLHDVGEPVVIQVLADEVAKKTNQPIPTQVMDATVSEFHELVGAKMAREWGFPDWVVETISHHHDASQAEGFRGKVMLACLSDEFSRWALDEEATADDFPTELDVLEDLSLLGKDIIALLGQRGQVLNVVEAFL